MKVEEMEQGVIPTNKIVLGDAMIGLKKIPDVSIDLIITDPPYGDNASYGRMDKEIENNEHPLLNCQALFEFQRILKPNTTIYNFTNWKHYPFLTEFVMRYTTFKIRHMIVCNKSNIGMGYGFRNKHELILVLEKGTAKYNNTDFPTVIDFNMVQHDEDTHPHEKPEDLIRKLILHSSKEGDLILDAFMGSGSTAITCKQLKRNFVGFEIVPEFIDQANERLKQQTLF